MGVRRSGERDKTQNDSNDTVGAGLKTADICSRQCAHGPAIGVGVSLSFDFISESSQEENASPDILPVTLSRLNLGRSRCAGEQNQLVKDGQASRDGSLPQVDKELCIPVVVNVSSARTFRTFL